MFLLFPFSFSCRIFQEVIRGAQRDMQELIYNGDLRGAINLWEEHNRWMFIHMTMEEGLPNKVGQTPMGMFR